MGFEKQSLEENMSEFALYLFEIGNAIFQDDDINKMIESIKATISADKEE